MRRLEKRVFAAQHVKSLIVGQYKQQVGSLHFLAMLVREALGWALTDGCLAAEDGGGLLAASSLERPGVA